MNKRSVLNHLSGASLLALALVVRPAAAELNDEQWRMLDEYCVECHNLEDFAGGLALNLLPHDQVPAEAENWEAVIRKLKAGMMPPPGNPRPPEARVEGFLAGLEETLDSAARRAPRPGAPLLHRLNRTEYENAVRDLLALPIEAEAMLPADDSSGGFDNISNVLSVSPALMQAYVSAAAKISRLAIGDSTITSATTTYLADGASQASHKAGMPLGTRGGIAAEHVFPLDAEYEISVGRSGTFSAFSLEPVGGEDPVEIVIDGERVRLLRPDQRGTVRLPVAAGPHVIEAAYLPTSPGRGVDDLHEVWASSTGIRSLDITGPLSPTGAGDTPSRRRIFTCQPQAPAQQAGCARDILSTLAARAYRRPVDDESLDILMDFYRKGKELRGFDTGIQYALARILVDPQFIFRFEPEPELLADGEVYGIGDYELASRLSFFIWSSIPDAELLELASAGKLNDPAVLKRQVSRMLADPKADALVDNFANQWLSLRRLATLNPTSEDFDGSLREAMREETELLFQNMLRDDRSVLDLLNADYTYVNERLAEHYGIPNIRGSHFRRVSLEDGARRGLLGHSSILTITSAPNRTSPVIRGTWIMENLLGTPPPPPPAGVETNLEETAAAGAAPTTIRQRLERHRADPSCAACHNLIDPLGFALENFDAVGKWRDTAQGRPVNASAELWDGTLLSGPDGLRQALLERRELFVETLTEKLMTYALGRTVEYFDMPSVRAVVGAAERDDYRFGALVQGIVDTPAFRMRRKTGEQAPGPVALADNANSNED